MKILIIFLMFLVGCDTPDNYWDTDSGPDFETDTDTGEDTDTESAGSDVDSDTDSDSDLDSDTDGDTDTDSDLDTDTDSDSDTDTDSDSDTDIDMDSDTDTDTGSIQVCSPGETQQCFCIGGKTGVQVCNGDGSAWGTCECRPECPRNSGWPCTCDGFGSICNDGSLCHGFFEPYNTIGICSRKCKDDNANIIADCNTAFDAEDVCGVGGPYCRLVCGTDSDCPQDQKCAEPYVDTGVHNCIPK